MASWNDFYGTNYNVYDHAPEWMSMDVGTAASQWIRYPPRQQPNYDVFWDPYASQNAGHGSGRPVITMVLKVPICCEGCEEKVKSRLIDIDGVHGVSVDQLQQKVTVSGTAHHEEILEACKKLFKRSKWWPS